MERELAYTLQQGLNALQLAGFYMPLAVAFALIQAVTRRVFLSFGQMAMFGSFAAVYSCFYGILNGFGDAGAGLLAIATGIACAGALGFASSHLLFQPLLQRSVQSYMIAAVAFMIVIEEVMRLQSEGRDIWIPRLFDGDSLPVLTGNNVVNLPIPNIVALGLSGLTVAAVAAAMKLTSFGRNWLACAQEPRLARLCGVNADRVVAATFTLGAGLSAVSGWIAAITYGGTSFSSGAMLGFKAMFAAAIGGFGSLRGAALGALLLGVLEVVWSGLYSSTWRDIGVFGVMVVLLLFRPEGLSGLDSARESEAP
jgi:branched-chain amino acid transport system permease protein